MRIVLFGGVKVQFPDREVAHFTTSRNAALLTYLALRPNRHVSRIELQEAIWPDRDEEAARASLRTALYTLERDLGQSILTTTRQDVSFTDLPETDTDDFMHEIRLAKRARTDDEERMHLRRAHTLYVGPLAPQLADLWILSEREYFSDVYCELMTGLIRLEESIGEFDQALEYARDLVRIHPHGERGHCAMIRLMARIGNRAEALERHRDFKARLQQEIGLRPMKSTESLADSIAAGSFDAAPAFENEHLDFLDGAIEWYLRSDPDRAITLLCSSSEYWLQRRNDHAGIDIVRRVIATGGGTALQQAQLNRMAGMMHMNVAEFVQASERLDQALRQYKALSETDAFMATLSQHAFCLMQIGKYEQGIRILEAQMDKLGSVNDPKVVIAYRNNYAVIVWHAGGREKALEIYREIVGLAREHGQWSLVSVTASNIAILLSQLNKNDEATRHAKLALETALAHGDTVSLGFAYIAEGWTQLNGNLGGDFRIPFGKALQIGARSGHPRVITLALESLAVALGHAKCWTEAMVIIRSTSAERDRIGLHRTPVEAEYHDWLEAQFLEEMSAEQRDTAASLAGSLDKNGLISYAHDLTHTN